jgi:hypothetical protein
LPNSLKADDPKKFSSNQSHEDVQHSEDKKANAGNSEQLSPGLVPLLPFGRSGGVIADGRAAKPVVASE